MSLKRLLDLSGKVALVTGGSRGLGLQMAEALGEMGARVAITARKAAELDVAVKHLAAQGIEALAVPVDLGRRESIPAMVDAVAARFGTVDVLVNNAGTTWGAPAEDYPAEAWDKVMRLNIDAMFFLSQEVGRRFMIPRRSGKIVNVASVSGLSGNPPGMQTIAYNASKGAAVNLTRALAAEWGKYDINVNAICPGFFPSKMTHGLLDVDRRHGDRDDAARPAGRRGGPQGRGGLPGLRRLPPRHRAVPGGGRRRLPLLTRRSPWTSRFRIACGASRVSSGSSCGRRSSRSSRASGTAASRRILPELRRVREKARETGLFAAHMPPEYGGAHLPLTEFAHLSEELGKSPLGHYCFNVPGARHREHGAHPRARDRGAEGALAPAARARRDPQLLHHDRARVRRLEPGLDGDHRPQGGRRVGDPRPQVVRLVGRRRRLRGLHGGHQPRAQKTPTSAPA